MSVLVDMSSNKHKKRTVNSIFLSRKFQLQKNPSEEKLALIENFKTKNILVLARNLKESDSNFFSCFEKNAKQVLEIQITL